MTSKARIEITAEDRGATKAVTGIKGLFNDLKAGAKDSILTGVGLGAGVSAFGLMQSAVSGVFDAFKLGASELIEAETQMAQTEARIKSTGGAAKVSKDDVRALAEGIQDLTGMDAEAVQGGQNLLLTFTKIRNEAGKGNDVFDQATKSMANMSVAFGMDMPSAALLLGKALNDPIKGVTALRRAGVDLNAQQRDQIKAFVEAGDVMSAQKIILKELETQVGGSAEAMGNTTQGKLNKFARAWEDLTSSIVLGAVRVAEGFEEHVVQPVSDGVDDLAMNFGSMGDRIHAIADGAGVDFQQVKDRVKELQETTGLSFEEAAKVAERELSKVPKTAKRTMGEVTTELHSQLMAAKGIVETDMEQVARVPEEAIRARFTAIRDAAYQSQVEYAKGLLDAQNEPKLAMDALGQIQEEELDKAAEVARLKGQLASQQLASGLQDERDGVRAQAQAARQAIVDRLAALGIDAYSWGVNIGGELARGIEVTANRGGVVRTAAGKLAQAVSGQIGIRSEPKDSDSPLRGITKFGPNIVHTVAAGVMRELGAAKSAGSALAKALKPSLPNLGRLNGGGDPGAVGGAGGPGLAGGAPVIIQLVADGRTLAEIVDPWLYRLQPAGASVLPRGS